MEVYVTLKVVEDGKVIEKTVQVQSDNYDWIDDAEDALKTAVAHISEVWRSEAR